MIDAIFQSDGMTVTASIKGHAGAGAYGQDLVCASASILAYTLAQNVCEMYDRCLLQKEPEVHCESGNAYISCTAICSHLTDVINVYLVIATGYALLADQYSENVRYTNTITYK